MSASGTWTKCHCCASDMWTPAALTEAALAARGVIEFYCAYGHSQVYVKGESQETLLRRERDQLKQRQAQLQDAVADEKRKREHAMRLLEIASAETAATKKSLVKLKKRTAAGTCPCCNRSFSALSQHIATKHPTFRAEDMGRENVVSLIKSKAS